MTFCAPSNGTMVIVRESAEHGGMRGEVISSDASGVLVESEDGRHTYPAADLMIRWTMPEGDWRITNERMYA